MKLLDIINQIKRTLPKYSDDFAESLDISSITVSGGTATVVTSTQHHMSTGDEVIINDVQTKTAISDVSKDGNVVTFTTSTAHDLTYDWPEHETVELIGFTDTDWNDEFTITDVPNRYTFKVQSLLDEPVLNGNEKLLEIRDDGVNGRHEVTVTGTKSFTLPGITLDASYYSGTIQAGARIAGAVTVEHALEMYTEQEQEDLWCYVVMNDIAVSRDQSSTSDALATKMVGEDMRMRLVDGFKVIFIKNVSDDMSAVEAVDLFRHDLMLPMLKSVYGAIFDTGLSGDGDFRCIMKSANFVSYNLAAFAYGYEFEVVMDITNDDAVTDGDTRAFRNISYTEEINDNTENPLTVTQINLDDEP